MGSSKINEISEELAVKGEKKRHQEALKTDGDTDTYSEHQMRKSGHIMCENVPIREGVNTRTWKEWEHSKRSQNFTDKHREIDCGIGVCISADKSVC